MWSYEAIGNGDRPPRWRTVLLIVVLGFLSLFSVVFSPMAWREESRGDGVDTLLIGAAMLVAVALPLGVIWRHKFPFALTVTGALVPLLLPVGNYVAFVGLASLISRRRGPRVWATAGLVAVTSSVVVVRDYLAQPLAASLLKNFFGPQNGNPSEPMSLSPVIPPVVAVLGIGLSVGVGLLLRWRRDAHLAHQVASSERVTSDRLGDEVARRQERERIAREVHDAMGHRLSILNLHAGALEANAQQDPRLRESASLVRQSAGEAMEDLRSLLSVLRQPLGAEPPDLPLTDLQDVVQDSFGAGQMINSSIFIQDAERAHPSLSRAVYRIVQEVLTNASKHAPEEAMRLSVTGSPATGVAIDARNRAYGCTEASVPGTSRGLAGIAERVELLGGTVKYGLETDGTTFRVHVELPWREVGA